MIHIVLKNEIEQNKIDTLLFLLKSWNIDAELQTTDVSASKKKNDFSLSIGMWKDYNINAEELRKQTWNRNK